MSHIPNELDRIPRQEIEILFKKQKEHALQTATSSFRHRRDKLMRLLEYIVRNASQIENATFADLKKPASETRISEIVVLTSEIKYHLKHLKRWMQPHRVSTPLLAVGTEGYIQYEAKGTSLIISPWNYPVSLAIKPLIGAISAGCTAILKPSEFTPHSAAFIETLVKNLFTPEEVAVVQGDKEVAAELLRLPFDHIFFTGSPAVGKIVMKAASEHLSSVSLELGGKSPVIVDETTDIHSTATQIAWAKFFNNGQTCIAPDYLLIHEKIKTPFLEEFKRAIRELYDNNGKPVQTSTDYGRIVNLLHFNRLKSLFDDALAKGATLVCGGTFDPDDRYIEPTVLDGANTAMSIMQEEIFGPILPVLTFSTISEAVKFVCAKEKPLALYVYTKEPKTADYVLSHTSSGNALVNELLLQYQHPEIPFGGVGNSGIGKANGFFSFQEFSNPKGVIKRQFGTIRFIYPPFTQAKEKIVNLLVKYF